MTDEGIKALCVSVNDCGEANATLLGQCKLIHSLDVYGTQVTMKGVILALENLPLLKKFDFDDKIQVIAELLRRGPSRNHLPGLRNITSLHNYHDFINNDHPTVLQTGDIEIVSAACVSVQKVVIQILSCDSIGPHGHTVKLLELKKLKTLRQLTFRCLGTNVTFNEAILPVLENFSNSITNLSLLAFRNIAFRVNIGTIIENCPKLQNLELNDCIIIPPFPRKYVKKTQVLDNLKVLELKYCKDITPEDLYLLLASPQLEDLALCFIDIPIDDCLRRAANVHQFRKLERVIFCSNDLVIIFLMMLNGRNMHLKLRRARPADGRVTLKEHWMRG